MNGDPKLYVRCREPQKLHWNCLLISLQSLLPEGPLERLGQIYTRVGDGVITVSNSVYERESMKAMKEWLSGIGKPTYALAPLSLPQRKRQQGGDTDLLLFLDAIKERFGTKSLIYVCPSTLVLKIVVTLPLDIIWHVLLATSTGEIDCSH